MWGLFRRIEKISKNVRSCLREPQRLALHAPIQWEAGFAHQAGGGEIAAAGGNAQVKLNLGYLHAWGIGVLKDLVLAYKWISLAGAARNKKAKTNP